MSNLRYKDKNLSLSGARLDLLDPGYAASALLDLIHSDSSAVTYQYRAVISKITSCIIKARDKEVDILVFDANLGFLPFYLEAITPMNINKRFFLINTHYNIKVNQLTEDLSKKITHITKSDLRDLLVHLANSPVLKKIIVVDILNQSIGDIFKELFLTLTFDAQVFIMNYSSVDTKSIHFELKKLGNVVIPEADMSAYVDFSHKR